MKDRKDFSEGLLKQLLDSIFRPSTPGTENRGLLAALGLFAFVGEEAVQVLFRKDFGKDGLDRLRLVLCFILFEILAAICFLTWHYADHPLENIGSEQSFVWAGIFYLILGFVVLQKGSRDYEKALASKKPYKYTGDSALLEFLASEGWSQSKIQNFWEPIFVIGIGTFLSFINLLWGIPVIYCGLSVWICNILDRLFLEPPNSQNPGQSSFGRRSSNTK